MTSSPSSDSWDTCETATLADFAGNGGFAHQDASNAVCTFGHSPLPSARPVFGFGETLREGASSEEVRALSNSVAALSSQIETLAQVLNSRLSDGDDSPPSVVGDQGAISRATKLAAEMPVPAGWVLLGQHAATVSISANSSFVCQLRTDGSIWKLDRWHLLDTPSDRWQVIDVNRDSAQIAVGQDGRIYQRGKDGHLFLYSGLGCQWAPLRGDSDAVEIHLAGSELIMVDSHEQCSVCYDSAARRGRGKSIIPGHSPHCSPVDPGLPYRIVASPDGRLYVHTAGSDKLFVTRGDHGSACWELDLAGPNVGLIATNDGLYQLKSDGRILTWRKEWEVGSWEMLSIDDRTMEIAADNNGLFRRDRDGSVYRYSGEPHKWDLKGKIPRAMHLAATSTALYVLCNDGAILALKL